MAHQKTRNMPIIRFSMDECHKQIFPEDCIFNDIEDLQCDAEFCLELLFYALGTLKKHQMTVRSNTLELRNLLQQT